MWIVKLGGSLGRAPDLPEWLTLMSQLGGGRVIVVPGGGGLADEVRRLQTHWHFNDLAAHNMAVLAMAQNAWMLQALEPSLCLVSREADIPRAMRRGKALVWAPLELVQNQADDTTNWDVTSDSIALSLALRLNAERLLVVKSAAVDGCKSLAELVQAEVLDRRFDALASRAPFPIDVLSREQLALVRALLLGEPRGQRA